MLRMAWLSMLHMTAIGANPAILQYFMAAPGLFAEIPAGLQDFACFNVAGGEAG
ncbi:hypothetical protein [Paenibacillus dendritiformis]|uniref:hypothetical protein n=1 Tax=Paenibacillus dendritiformis TaxID=130049 RepID=UPI0018CCBBD6|nr:hypothetical protein [Paenibacillus dendritiformis]